MAVFKTYSTGVEVNGESILAVVEGLGAFKKTAYQILGENGIKDPEPGKWFNLQNYLNAFQVISQKLGNATLKVIGMKIPETAVLPPQLDTIEKALTMMDQAYHMNYQYGEIGHYAFEKKGKNKGVMICSSPYPCAYDIGIIEGFMYRLRKSNEIPRVKHVPGECRMDGAKQCKYEVSW
ncbi:MAG: hypothetical protein ACFFAO_14995 [Candidatus Hermodarchaeota archaeon]